MRNVIWNAAKRGYGWQPDLPDARDFAYAAPRMARLPALVDLRAHCPPVYDQGQLGSCTGNAIAAAVQFERMKQGLANAASLTPSRLFIYYNERVIEHTVRSDSGAQLRDGIKTVAQKGVCFESGAADWPYVIAKFADKPKAACYSFAHGNLALTYLRVTPSLDQLKGCLASGFPFVFGFTVYASFESATVAKSGVVPMPKPGERVLGGHAVCAVGYDDGQQRFICRNSWGEGWGQAGTFTMPYAYLTDPNLADDFWTVRVMEAVHHARAKAA